MIESLSFITSYLLGLCIALDRMVSNTIFAYIMYMSTKTLAVDTQQKRLSLVILIGSRNILCYGIKTLLLTKVPYMKLWICDVNMTKTYLYSFEPLKPHFYVVKLGVTGVYIIFLILLKTDCGYSIEPPR